MIRINIVYRNMPVAAPPVISAVGGEALVVWSRVEADAADVVVYFNYYSYRAKVAARYPNRRRILFISEPVVVAPDQYRLATWKKFDHVLTWCGALLQPGAPFSYLPVIHFDYPFPAGHGVAGAPERFLQTPRRTALCQICGDKRSLIAGELYSERRRVARWFHEHGTLPFDVFGRPAMAVPNYRGVTADKLATLSEYQFALCFENNHHPRWAAGYVTEKLFDCFHALTIPIYLGAPDITAQVPADCFIDYREFASLQQLHDHLLGLSAEACQQYRENILQFLRVHRATERYSCFRLYERAAQVAEAPPASAAPRFPRDYLQSETSFQNRLRFRLMAAAVRLHKLVPVMLAAWRRLRPE
jgi:alpha(1,3/1,4) fucosyltransferase